jgi:uncharacterized protein YukE
VALLPTLLAIGIGVALGLHWGGRVDNLLAWRPPLWQALGAGVSLLVVLDLVPIGGAFAAFLRILAMVAVMAFTVVNIRIGGMVLVAAGTALDLLVTVLNWGMPVSGSALVSAGIVSEADLATVELNGGRELADGAALGFLGDTIPLPWGHVISIGDLLVLVGITLVTASVARRYQVGGGYSAFGGNGRFNGRGGPSDYRSALDALGRGPAPRRGPGLHPSRLPRQRAGAKRRSVGRTPASRSRDGSRPGSRSTGTRSSRAAPPAADRGALLLTSGLLSALLCIGVDDGARHRRTAAMAQLGMDPEQMGTLQKTMQREAGQIRTLAKQLDGQLKGAWWKGTDADRFRADWDGTHRTGLERIAAALEAQAKVIATNVAQQTQASQG